MIKQVALALFFATPAISQDLPAHFVTTGVAADDTLNIRAMPDASAPIIGEFGPYTLNIEVLRTVNNRSWGYVGFGDQNGWVAMRYLEPSNHQEPHAFPRPMSCHGAEPFWSLNITVRDDEYHAIDDTRRELNMIHHSTGSNGAMAVFEEGPTLNRTLIVQKGYCSDGMADREFGWKATLFTEAPDGNGAQSGCCTMDTNR